MKFTCKVTINKPREEVVRLMNNPDNLKHWQEGFVRYEHLSGEPGAEGAQALMVYDMKGKELELVETIIKNDFPDEFVGRYECDPMTNTMANRFIDEVNGVTTYIADIDYVKINSFMMKIIAFLFPGMMKKQTQKWLDNFKRFCEES